jgi:hypothetical protein
MFGRLRFQKVIDEQIDVFVRDHEDVLDDVADRLEAYNRAERDEAEELYGDYVDAAETGIEILAEMRDHFAATLEDPERYVREFNTAVKRRLPSFIVGIDA